MPQFIDSIEYTGTEGSKVTLDGITSVSTVDASTLSVAEAQHAVSADNATNATNATNIIPNENGAVNPLGRKADSVVGESSIAFGNNSTASADSSIALGRETIASGGVSTAIGSTATASGTRSAALGYAAKAIGADSTALGYDSQASGDFSIALGRDSQASGDFSIALGRDTEASGENSTALGYDSTAFGMHSTAVGNVARALGENSTALGYDSTAQGDSSTALGRGATASGNFSTALGCRTVAVLDDAASNTTASGEYSTALGSGAYAQGDSSTALGHDSRALGLCSTALGESATTSSSDTNVMQLGGGALAALLCRVNLTTPSDRRDKTDIEGITDALAFLERLNPVTFVNNNRVEYISDEDKKGENYRTYGMCEYDRVSHAAGTKKGERRRCGLIAQEVVEAMQSVYGTDNYADIVNDSFHDLAQKPSDVENKYTLAYANLVPFLIGAIKELNAEIKALESKLATSNGASAQGD